MRKPSILVGVLTAGIALVHQRPTIGAEADTVVYHDMAAIPKAPWGPFPEERAVLTDTCSVVIASLAPRYTQPVHRHNQEQFSLGLGGAVGYTIGGAHHEVGSHVAVLPPSNVMHGIVNDSDQPALMMEYQPVLRKEYLPPHPQVPPQPQSAEPVPLAADQMVAMDFDRTSSGWRVEKNGARVKAFSGKTIRASFWDLAAKGASVEVAEHPSARERLVFVLDGHVASVVGKTRRETGPEMLVEVRPSAKSVKMTSLGNGPAFVVVFETITR